jgi:hypothetical protein
MTVHPRIGLLYCNWPRCDLYTTIPGSIKYAQETTYGALCAVLQDVFNPSTPNGHYSGRTAPLTSSLQTLHFKYLFNKYPY